VLGAEAGKRRRTDTRKTAGDSFVTLMAGYYNENFHVDMPQTFHTTDRRIALTRPLLYAELDYCNSAGKTLTRTHTNPLRSLSCSDAAKCRLACNL